MTDSELCGRFGIVRAAGSVQGSLLLPSVECATVHSLALEPARAPRGPRPGGTTAHYPYSDLRTFHHYRPTAGQPAKAGEATGWTDRLAEQSKITGREDADGPGHGTSFWLVIIGCN